MSDSIDYSIYYRRWHNGSLEELKQQSKLYERWIGSSIRQHSPTMKVLDYGCGFGSLVYFLQQHFTDVQGVDASKEQISVANSHNLPVKLVTVAEFPNWCNNLKNTLDIIFLFDVLEHIPVNNQISFMRMLVSMLKPNGIIYIKVPNANSLLANRWRYNDWTHSSSFTECSLDFVCLNAGLNNIEYMADESALKPRYWWIPRWSIRGFYIKTLFRKIWKLYLKAELGEQADTIQVGYNLFAKAGKPKNAQ